MNKFVVVYILLWLRIELNVAQKFENKLRRRAWKSVTKVINNNYYVQDLQQYSVSEHRKEKMEDKVIGKNLKREGCKQILWTWALQ